jgi:hypothetical protein
VVDQQTSETKGSTYKLVINDKSSLDAQIIARNYDLDVALLKVVKTSDVALLSKIHPLPLKLDSTDTNLTVLGHPLGDQPALFVSTPITVEMQDRNGLEVVKESLDRGYSGGPVIDAAGSVVAIALRQGDYSSDSFLRKVDTIREFLEANEIVESTHGQEKHLSLSSLATIEKVATLEKQLDDLKQKVEVKQFIIEEMKKQLVQWDVTICEIPRPPKVPGKPKHRLVIQFKKPNALFDPKTDDEFAAQIIPVMTGETESEARTRNLFVPKTVTFDGQKWSVEPLDDDVEAHLRFYNEAPEHADSKLGMKNIDGFAITLEPPKENGELQYLAFQQRSVKVGVGRCDGEQPNSPP